jgi:hypothetical protein
MTDLNTASVRDLRDELRRRRAGVPEPLKSPEWAELHRLIVRGINKHTVGLKEDHFRHYVFYAAITAVYGGDFWKWWNDHSRSDDLKPFS